MQQLGPNAFGEMLEPGRVGDCYLGLQLPPPPAGEPEAGTVLIVAPAALLHPRVPQPAGSQLYELVTGHPERQPGERRKLPGPPAPHGGPSSRHSR